MSGRIYTDDTKMSSEYVYKNQDFYFVFLPEALEYARIRAIGDEVRAEVKNILTLPDTIGLFELTKKKPKDYVTYGRNGPPLKLTHNLFSSIEQSVMYWTGFNHLSIDSGRVTSLDRSKSISMTYSARYGDVLIRLSVGSALFKISKRALNNARQKYVKKYGNVINSIEMDIEAQHITASGLLSAGVIKIYLPYNLYEIIQSFIASGHQYFICMVCTIKNPNYNDDEGLNILLYLEDFSTMSPLSIIFLGREVLDDDKMFKTVFLSMDQVDSIEGLINSEKKGDISEQTLSRITNISILDDAYELKFLMPDFLSALLKINDLKPIADLFAGNSIFNGIESAVARLSKMTDFTEDGKSPLEKETKEKLRNVKERFL